MDEVGELIVSGPNVMQGYFDDKKMFDYEKQLGYTNENFYEKYKKLRNKRIKLIKYLKEIQEDYSTLSQQE